MKKKLIITSAALSTILSPCLIGRSALAGGASLSASTTSITVGNSFTLYVNVNAVAAWNVHVTTSGPVSGGCGINQADASVDAANTSKSFSVTCTGTSTGTISASLSGDVTTEMGVNSNISGNVNITVNAAPSQPAAPPSTSSQPAAPARSAVPSQPAAPSQQSSNQTPEPEPEPEVILDNNTELSELKIKDYELEENEDGSYSVVIPHDVSVIEVIASAESEKSSLAGTGSFQLENGENLIEVIVTAEDGTAKTYIIKAIREESCSACDECESCSPLFMIVSIIEGFIILGLVAWIVYGKINNSKGTKAQTMPDNQYTTPQRNDNIQH